MAGWRMRYAVLLYHLHPALRLMRSKAGPRACVCYNTSTMAILNLIASRVVDHADEAAVNDERAPDPAALWLCQLPGMTVPLLQQLLAAAESPAAIMRLSSRVLRELGVAPALVANIVAGPRQVPQVAAGLKGLQRLGIVPLPWAAPSYPERLRELPQPPLVVYVQGCWPPPPALVLVIGAGELSPKLGAAWLSLVDALRPQVSLAAVQTDAPVPTVLAERDVQLLGVPFGLMLSRQRLPKPLWQLVAARQTTLVSISPPNAQPDPAGAQRLPEVLLALTAALVLVQPAEDAAPDLLCATARALGLPGFIFGAAGRVPTNAAPLPPGLRRLRPAGAGLRTLRLALGLRSSGADLVQQERLF